MYRLKKYGGDAPASSESDEDDEPSHELQAIGR